MANQYFLLLLFACFFSIGFYACNSTATTTSTDASTNTDETYIELPVGKSIVNFENKKVWFVGKESEMVHQHMMKGSYSPDGDKDPEKHIYIDYNENGGQIVGYYRGFDIPKDKKTHKFYGKVLSMSGAGKGGGTHTEYYIMLDKVE